MAWCSWHIIGDFVGDRNEISPQLLLLCVEKPYKNSPCYHKNQKNRSNYFLMFLASLGNDKLKMPSVSNLYGMKVFYFVVRLQLFLLLNLVLI